MRKKDKMRCVISHLRENRYLLKGTPDQDAIIELAAGQNDSYILIAVEGGNIRDLPGSIIVIPGGYLVFKKLFEANKRPAMYLIKDIAQQLMTAPKDSISVREDRVLMGGYEFTFAIAKDGYTPVGYISMADGKKILNMPANDTASLSAPQNPSDSAIHEPNQQQSLHIGGHTADVSDKVVVSEPVKPVAEPSNKALSIISAIAEDERNLALIKDIAYTAYSIISKVKNSGAASKEEIATCIVAALAAPETRSALRRIGSDIFRRFTELNKEAGSVVEVTPGYRVTPDGEIIFDEFPDSDMLIAASAGMKQRIIKAYINYDRSLGYPEAFIHCGSADFGYIAKTAPLMFAPTQDGHVVGFFDDQLQSIVSLIYAGFKDGVFFALVMENQQIYEVSTSHSPSVFGCCIIAGEKKESLLCKNQDGIIAEYMSVCTDICVVRHQYLNFIIDAMPDKVIQVISPHKDDTKALLRKGYSIGTERKGDNWILWGFPTGKTLSVNGLPRSIVGGNPQY